MTAERALIDFSTAVIDRRYKIVLRIGLAARRVTSEVVAVAADLDLLEARASVKAEGNALDVTLEGTWQITAPRPSWEKLLGAQSPQRVRLRRSGPRAQWLSDLQWALLNKLDFTFNY